MVEQHVLLQDKVPFDLPGTESSVGSFMWLGRSEAIDRNLIAHLEGRIKRCHFMKGFTGGDLYLQVENDQSYSHRLQHDMYFLTSTSRLNEQVVDKIILQLNRVYPQILTNEEAEKFRNPRASLHTRLSDLLKHLQKKGDRHCQEFYRALQINAEQLFNDLPSRKILKTPDPTEIDTDKEQYMLNDRGPVFFLACFSVAAGLALFWYCCNSGKAEPPLIVLVVMLGLSLSQDKSYPMG
ncbi:caspase recruitment domain family member 19 [Pitangus sulphuratus]|nr:caspase recruitment domain family member 19 [Pitangus sulphuratus]